MYRMSRIQDIVTDKMQQQLFDFTYMFFAARWGILLDFFRAFVQIVSELGSTFNDRHD